jgi:hypothetical protein
MFAKRFLRVLALLLVLTTLAICFTSCFDVDSLLNYDQQTTTNSETDNNNNSNNKSNNNSSDSTEKNNAFDELVNYILEHGEFDYSNGRTHLELHDGYTSSSKDEYTIVEFDYNPSNQEVMLTLFVALETTQNQPEAYMTIGLKENTSQYRYAMKVDHGDSTTSSLEGYINSKTFTRDTWPEYQDYNGDPSDLDATRGFANVMATELLDYLDRLVSYRLNLSMADFGFVAYN